MPRRAAEILLLPRQLAILERLGRSSTEEQRIVERARIITMSADGQLCVDQAEVLGIDAQRVRRWRRRWASEMDRLMAAELLPVSDAELEVLIVDVLRDDYRPGAPPTFSPEQIAQIISLACEEPETLGLPVTHWTPGELAREAKKRKIVDDISPRHVARFFFRDGNSTPPVAVLAQSKDHRPSPARGRGPGRLRRLRSGGQTGG